MRPYVVDGRWIIYARDTTHAAVRFQLFVQNSHNWPSIRPASTADLALYPKVG